MKTKVKKVLVMAASTILYLCIAGYITLPHLVIYNYTASLPVGWYWLEPAASLRHGDIILCDADEDTMQLAVERQWINPNTHFLKCIYGLPGDVYEIRAHRYIVNGEDKGEIKQYDSAGRKLPLQPDGKYIVPEGYILTGTSEENSFDSRYYGPIPIKNVYNKAHYLCAGFRGWFDGEDL